MDSLQKAIRNILNEADSDWVVYVAQPLASQAKLKGKVKVFKSYKGASNYANKTGGDIYSSIYFADNRDDILSGKINKKRKR